MNAQTQKVDVLAVSPWRVEFMRCGFASTYDVVRGHGRTTEHAMVWNGYLRMNLCAAYLDKADAQKHADSLNASLARIVGAP